MNINEKILNFLKMQKGLETATFSEINVTTEQNKDGNNLIYIKASVLEKQIENNYVNYSKYYAFDKNANYVGYVRATVMNNIPANEVELEYWVKDQYKNRGNITVLAKDVIRDIFEEKSFDNLKVRKGLPTSKIELIMVAINPNNYASLAVSRKLGFNENGYLHIEDYYKNQDIKTIR